MTSYSTETRTELESVTTTYLAQTVAQSLVTDPPGHTSFVARTLTTVRKAREADLALVTTTSSHIRLTATNGK